jgi:NADPH:quinone reductase
MEQSRQPDRTYRLIADLVERVGAGELRSVIDRTFQLADAAEAHGYAELGTAVGRVLIVP